MAVKLFIGVIDLFVHSIMGMLRATNGFWRKENRLIMLSLQMKINKLFLDFTYASHASFSIVISNFLYDFLHL